MIKLSIKQLTAIRELASARSFTVAATNLHTTQSNLSMTIREAEEIVGLRLFDRTTKFVTPTAAGESFSVSIGRLLDDLDLHITNLQSLGELSNGTLSIGVTPLLGSTLVAEAIAKFSELYPGIVIRMEDAPTQTLVTLLMRREIDLAIGTFEGRAVEIQMQPLFDDRLVALSHPSVGLAETVRWSDLSNRKIIGIDQGSSVGKMIEHAFLSATKRVVRPTIASHHWQTVMALTSYAKGVCIVPSYACISEFTKMLVRSELIEPKMSRTISFASIKGRSLSPAAEAFMNTLICMQK
ncbi:LysR family transcriptional regulator [Advenella incenata]|jgi:DNA-binding transcriptional LysR family regulator